MGHVPITGDKQQARQAWAATVKRLRYGRGWSQPRLAAELTTAATPTRRLTPDRTHVQRCLAGFEGAHHLPSEDYVIAFICTFATPEELASGTITAGSELDELLCALDRMGVPVDRRRFLLNAAACALTGTNTFRDWQPIPQGMSDPERITWALDHPGKVDRHTADLLYAWALSLARQLDTAPSPSVTLPHLMADLPRVRLLTRHAPDQRVRGRLLAAQAWVSAAAGRMWWGACRARDAAVAHCRQAVAAAQEVGEAAAGALAHHFLATIALHADGRPSEALGHADAAVALARQGSPTVAGWVTAFNGELHATLGSEAAALRRLDEARTCFGEVTGDDPLAGMFTEEQLGGYAGVYWLRLGRFRAAQQALVEAAERLGVERARHRAIVAADLAMACAALGDPVGAAAAAHQAFDAWELVQDSTGGLRVSGALWALRPWRSQGAVQEVWDRAVKLPLPTP